MDRKKTILIAVMINAGLLAALFIAALSSQDAVILTEPTVVENHAPLFPSEADHVLQNTSSIAKAPALAPLPMVEVAPMKEETPAPVVHKLPTPALEPAPQPQKILPAFAEVTVKKGDSLDKIAKTHHTTVDEIIQFNQLPGSFLKVGQVLKIPEKKIAVAPKPKVAIETQPAATGPEYYTVKAGDNPWTIAMKHHMKVEELLKLNLLNEEKARKLKAGDRLRIR